MPPLFSVTLTILLGILLFSQIFADISADGWGLIATLVLGGIGKLLLDYYQAQALAVKLSEDRKMIALALQTAAAKVSDKMDSATQLKVETVKHESALVVEAVKHEAEVMAAKVDMLADLKQRVVIRELEKTVTDLEKPDPEKIAEALAPKLAGAIADKAKVAPQATPQVTEMAVDAENVTVHRGPKKEQP